MAKETGTAADYLDLMVHLRDFLTLQSPTIHWTAVRDTTPAGSPIVYPSPNTQEMIFEGDASAGGSPQRLLYWGIQTFEDPATSRYTWRLRGFTGFDPGSPEGSIAFDLQPDPSPEVYVPLQNTAMDYWFWANERRVIMVVKTGTSYQWMYAGFLNPFATESEYPYPLLIMGSSFDITHAFNNNSIDYSTIVFPTGNSTETPISTATSVMWLRFVDGQWYPIKNGYESSNNLIARSDRVVWPMAPYAQADWSDDDAVNDLQQTMYSLYHAVTAGGTPVASLARTPASPDDLTPLYPLTIVWNEPSIQLIGEIDGCFWVHTAGGLTAEDEIFDTGVSPEQRYLVFQNIHRTDPWTFGAVKDA